MLHSTQFQRLCTPLYRYVTYGLSFGGNNAALVFLLLSGGGRMFLSKKAKGSISFSAQYALNASGLHLHKQACNRFRFVSDTSLHPALSFHQWAGQIPMFPRSENIGLANISAFFRRMVSLYSPFPCADHPNRRARQDNISVSYQNDIRDLSAAENPAGVGVVNCNPGDNQIFCHFEVTVPSLGRRLSSYNRCAACPFLPHSFVL